MNQLNLNKENPVREFTLNAADSHLLIKSVCVTSRTNTENQWTNLISKMKLTAELKYNVFDVSEVRFIDERIEQFPIHLIIDPYQVQPIFQVNKLIKNETIILGVNLERKFFNILKLEFQGIEKLEEDCNLALNIEKFKIDD